MGRIRKEEPPKVIETRLYKCIHPGMAKWMQGDGRDIVKRGWKALVRELGYGRAIMYCLVFSQGDLTVARRAWGGATIDEMLADLTLEEKLYTGDGPPPKAQEQRHVERSRRTKARKDRS